MQRGLSIIVEAVDRSLPWVSQAEADGNSGVRGERAASFISKGSPAPLYACQTQHARAPKRLL